MKSVTNLSPSILRTLRYIEWIFAAIHFGMSTAGYTLIRGTEFSLKTLAFLSIFIALSCMFPVHRPRWQKQGYIFLGILLAVSAKLIGVHLDLFIYIYIAKSCFLLGRESLLLIVIVTGIAWVASEFWSVHESIKLIKSFNFSPPYGFRSFNPWEITVSTLGVYLAGCTFVILFSSVIIAEQKSRQRAEALAKQVETLAATLERTRIARDIHDSLGHTLTNLDVQLEVAQKLRQRDLSKAFLALDTAKMLASQCIEDVSRALQTMRQSDFNLNQALGTLVEQVRRNQSLQVHWEVNLPKLPLQTSHQIYCIVKEGLMNIQKHARASCICLQGQVVPEGIILKLKDDGIGFDPELPHSGFGLKGMAERVQMLGGELKVKSVLGQGTHIQVTLPL